MTVPVNRMENLAASGSISGSLKVSSAGSPSSSSSLWGWQTSPHLAPSCSSSWGAAGSTARVVGLCRGGWAVPLWARFGPGSCLAAAAGTKPLHHREAEAHQERKRSAGSVVEQGGGQCPLAERAAVLVSSAPGLTPRSRQRNEPRVDIDMTGQKAKVQ